MRTKKHRTPSLCMGALFLAAGALLSVGELESVELGQAHAVIGRPLTPASGAGVARRTSRRTTRRTVARTTGAYGYGYGYAPGTVAALPAGCVRRTVSGALVYDCAGTIYRPVYDGPDVVYVVD